MKSENGAEVATSVQVKELLATGAQKPPGPPWNKVQLAIGFKMVMMGLVPPCAPTPAPRCKLTEQKLQCALVWALIGHGQDEHNISISFPNSSYIVPQ